MLLTLISWFFFNKRMFYLLFFVFNMFMFYFLLEWLYLTYMYGYSMLLFYLHVSLAFLSSLLFCMQLCLSFYYLLFQQFFVFSMCEFIIEVNFFITLNMFMSGFLWGIPMWGLTWLFDSRMFFSFCSLMFFLFIFVFRFFFDKILEKSYCNIMCLISILSFLNYPLSKFSVIWWNTLHQSESFSFFNENMGFHWLHLNLFVFFLFYYLLMMVYMMLLEIEKYMYINKKSMIL